MKIKAIIVDDELIARQTIQNHCTNFFADKIEILDLCDSVDSAIIAIEEHKPQLVFLDIDMPEKNGFELINHFKTIDFEIVFVTGHSNHFTKAIEYSALNFLMKPINPLNIKSIIESFENKGHLKNINRTGILKNNLTGENQTIILSNKGGFIVSLIADIIYCESSNSSGKCKITTTNDTITISRKMKDMMDSLPPDDFLQVSSSHIINRRFLKSYETKESRILLKNGVSIKVSEKNYNKKQLMDAIRK